MRSDIPVNDSTSPLWRVLGLLGDNPRKSGSGYEIRCPGHDDRHASLSVGVGNDGRVLLDCKAGCPTEKVLAAVGLGWDDLFEKSQAGNPVRRYRLLDQSGQVVAEHVREDLPGGDKKIRWEHNGKPGLNGTAVVDLPLYGEIGTDPTVPIIFCEGEKAAQALIDMGAVAVATVTGADKTPSDSVLSILHGRDVWLWPDNDVVGRQHMEKIAVRLKDKATVVKWVDWKDAPAKGDAADYIKAGGTIPGIWDLLTKDQIIVLDGPQIWRASELATMRFDSVRWAIPGLLPAGLTILAGRPKLGKSWLGLGWSIDVSRGVPCLKKMEVVQGEALYLALEDGPQRMQERIALMLGDHQPPNALHIATDWPRMNEGGLDLLEQFLGQHPFVRLITIDTFKRVRPKEKGNQRLYDLDYDAIQPVAALARQYNVAVIVVLHTRKGESSDPLEMVSGTLGLSGAADCVMVLRRERGQADASLFVTGRDVEEQDLALRWEKEDVLGWSLLGNAEDFRRSSERQAILDMVQSMPGLSPTDIADALGKARGAVRYLLFAMVRDAEIRVRDGKYYVTPNTPNTPNIGNAVYVPNTPHTLTPVSLTSPDSHTGGVRGVSGDVQNDRAYLDKCLSCGRDRATHGPNDPIKCEWKD